MEYLPLLYFCKSELEFDFHKLGSKLICRNKKMKHLDYKSDNYKLYKVY